MINFVDREGEIAFLNGLIVGREVVHELVEKTAKVVPDGGQGWQVYYTFFARSGFTAAQEEAQPHAAQLLTWEAMQAHLKPQG